MSRAVKGLIVVVCVALLCQPALAQGRGKDKGKSSGKQLAMEVAKHRQRVAQLERVRDLLEEKGNTNAAEQLGRAIDKEFDRHERAMARLGAGDPEALKRINGKVEELGDKPTRSDTRKGRREDRQDNREDRRDGRKDDRQDRRDDRQDKRGKTDGDDDDELIEPMSKHRKKAAEGINADNAEEALKKLEKEIDDDKEAKTDR